MGMCPVCNGMAQIDVHCQQCQQPLIDYGRTMDYGEKYDAYLPIDLKKENDSIPDDLINEQCPHYVTCTNCQQTSIYLINEQ
ncbi:hypothetical protein [Bacillus suaedae]|uniref:Uncharacterized protein n=1 Tax=Halalkalibacter suaedae TaxID=2822140 RepID=A0A940X028_9BACI|nr:hypothetical protein [Bacillus suaedae]MBP3951474.1 hypothetical protein [Bacillus suaedae]